MGFSDPLDVEVSVKPLKVDGDDVSVGDPRRLNIQPQRNNKYLVELKYDNGPRITVSKDDLRRALDACSA